jgi:hypothetical protein
MSADRGRSARAQAPVTARAIGGDEMRVVEILRGRLCGENQGDAAALSELAKLIPECDTRLLAVALKSLAKSAAGQEALWSTAP